MIEQPEQQEQNQFFATQIAQAPGQLSQEETKTIQTPQLSPEKNVDKIEKEPSSLRQLLTAFNSNDRQQKGLIKIEHVQEILNAKGIDHSRVKQYHSMSLPLYQDMVSFDEFLFIYTLSQNTSEKIEEKYALCKKVDERLIEFLKLLNKYRKKSEKKGNYKQAKNSKSKVQEIRNRQLQRRNKYLKILYEKEVEETETAQKHKFEQLCSKWDEFMNGYQMTAADMVKKVKDRQIVEIVDFEAKTRDDLASKMHFSKYLLELQLKEKNLVKLQEYQRARVVQEEIQQMRMREIKQKELADQETLQLKLRAFRKQQQSAISTLLQKIQKDRNEHMRQRQSQTQKLMIRSKSQLAEIDHRFNQTIKKIHQALNNLGLQSDKHIKTGRR